jgi:hypothetical protein
MGVVRHIACRDAMRKCYAVDIVLAPNRPEKFAVTEIETHTHAAVYTRPRKPIRKAAKSSTRQMVLIYRKSLTIW